MIQKQKKKTWAWFSKYIRLKHASSSGLCSCYTCGQVLPWKQIQAGHGIGGRSNNVLFNEDIVRPQCYGCNVAQYGKLDEFGAKLRKEIGKKYDKYLKEKHLEKHYTEQELIDMEQEFKAKAKLLAEEKGLTL